MIKTGDTIAISGFMLAVVAEELLIELEKRYIETKEPGNLTLIWGAGVGALGEGLDSGSIILHMPVCQTGNCRPLWLQ
jgi:acyl CoA:acetate/3-ketoacid CoA transferase